MTDPLLLSLAPWLRKVGEFLQSFAAGLGGVGIFLIAAADSSFLSLPEGNDLLIVILSAGNSWSNMAFYVAVTVLGSISGCLILYTIGRKGGSPLLRRRFSPEKIERAERLFRRHGVLTVVIPSILPPPCPFKIFVLSAGVFRLKAASFVIAVAVGRTIRYSMWGILAVLYGLQVKQFMQQNLRLLGWLLLVVFALAIAVTVFAYLQKVRRGK